VNRSLIEAQEAERAWLARELHDDVSQRVALVAMTLETLRQDLPPSEGQSIRCIEEAKKQIGELVSDIQALSHRLHSSKLELQGLIGAARGLCRELSDRHNIEIILDSRDIPKELPQEVALCLFRVLQEALQNAMKHSGVRQFEVSLKGALNEIQLTVHDAGAGFDREKAISGHGLGLTSMRERLNLVNGQLSIDSQFLRGTTIRARVPLSSDITSGGKPE
jgi:signal transduction histidine kinase